MKAIIKQTKRNVYINFEGKTYRTNNLWDNKKFEVITNEIDFTNGAEFYAESVEHAYEQLIMIFKAEKFKRDTEKETIKLKMEEIISNSNNYSPIEIWEAVKWSAKQGHGWGATDILLENNPLSKLLLSKIGSYTVSPFDDNSIMIKAGNQRYGTLRKWKSVEDLF